MDFLIYVYIYIYNKNILKSEKKMTADFNSLYKEVQKLLQCAHFNNLKIFVLYVINFQNIADSIFKNHEIVRIVRSLFTIQFHLKKNQESELQVENFVNINLDHMFIYPLHADHTIPKLCVSDFAWSVVFIQSLIEQKHMKTFFILSQRMTCNP